MKKAHFTWIITEEVEGLLLRDFLRFNQHISRKALADIKFNDGKITVNDREENVRYILNKGDVVRVFFPKEEVSEWIKPSPIPLHILFEDEHLLVLNKPPGLPTIPSRDVKEESLAGAVIHYYQRNDYSYTFHGINRLDKDTSGLMMVAKHRYIHDLFMKQQQEYKVHRIYKALVHGNITECKGTIDAPIARKATSIIEREVSSAGQRAISHYTVEEQYSNGALVKIALETGRTHQIRVHFSYLGHPLLGDTLYGGKREGIDRQALHSSKLRFFHPIEKREFTFSSPLPSDMEKKLEALKIENI
ncbi:RluA family pseudouridine synthase [Evansella sp. AB-P1]|uniref:RluA family pseudouridine synthase n=1 Tax=Evansella sp. AB-P1 TaxID=3037653 RepID=UPI00241E2BF9|nr:RluA family pseudouridine synthase [Evansella sp. AB-P1]MDG5789123.1 RluA family pseudouridine synthase [Evansella sp. AB-P1]